VSPAEAHFFLVYHFDANQIVDGICIFYEIQQKGFILLKKDQCNLLLISFDTEKSETVYQTKVSTDFLEKLYCASPF